MNLKKGVEVNDRLVGLKRINDNEARDDEVARRDYGEQGSRHHHP